MIAIKVWRGTLVTLVRQVHFLFLFEQQRNKDKQSSSPLVQYENACDGWDQAWPTLKAWNSIHISRIGGRKPTVGAITRPSSGAHQQKARVGCCSWFSQLGTLIIECEHPSLAASLLGPNPIKFIFKFTPPKAILEEAYIGFSLSLEILLLIKCKTYRT